MTQLTDGINCYDSLPGMTAVFDSCAAADRFRGQTAQELVRWQEASRRTLRSILGLDKLERLREIPAARGGTGTDPGDGGIWTVTGEELTDDGITRIHGVFRVDAYTRMPMYVLKPQGEPAGICLALAGHQGGGKESVAGVRTRACVRSRMESFHYDYGLKLAEAGYLTICPDPRGFGERRDAAMQGDTDERVLGCTCRNISNMAIPLGLSAAGLCTYDLMRLIDHLSSEANEITDGAADGISAVGFSGGGMQALYLSAVDTRVKTALISGYMYGVRDALLYLNNNCSCNYVPGLWEHFDLGDIAAMAAPRRLIIQSCSGDHLNGPRGIVNAAEQVELIRRAYSLLDADDRLTHDIRPGGHRFHEEVLTEIMK